MVKEMKNIYKLEMFGAIIGIFVIGMFILPSSPTFTGYVSGLNLTIYSQSLDVMIDGSQSYTLTTGDGNLHLRSFMIDGEVIGDGRAEILLDNGKGQQYMVYDNKQKKLEYGGPSITGITAGITGNVVSTESSSAESETNGESDSAGRGIYLVMQPKNKINYEFLPLKEDEEVISGEFYSVCAETCNMPAELFNFHTYGLIFRLEKGTDVKLKEIKYILQDEETK